MNEILIGIGMMVVIFGFSFGMAKLHERAWRWQARKEEAERRAFESKRFNEKLLEN